MKVPNKNIINDIIDKELEENKTFVVDTNEFDTENMINSVVPSEEKFNKAIEKIIRKSNEYRRYIGILKNNIDLTSCKFLKRVDVSEIRRVNIEMHHYPFTLYDIVSMHRERIKQDLGEFYSYDTFTIAENIMKMHYENKIGIVPLSYTAHELAHSGKLVIPLNKDYVFGNWQELEKEDIIITDSMRKQLEVLEQMTNSIESGSLNSNEDLFSNIQTVINMKSSGIPNKIIKEKSIIEDINNPETDEDII
ncbi:hypothetical protein FPHOBKDP_00017 [Listeria phage LPJP1]|nr:hypothetical protein FPHOBKDP_00017 [Listeria phage LPJP1]